MVDDDIINNNNLTTVEEDVHGIGKEVENFDISVGEVSSATSNQPASKRGKSTR